MNRLSQGLTSKKLVHRTKGFQPDTGKYFKVTTSSALDDKTNYSLVMFYENKGIINSGTGSNQGLFSMEVGGSTDSGFYIVWVNADLYTFIGDGSGTSVIDSNAAGNGVIGWGGSGAVTQRGGYLNCLALTYDASGNELKVYFLNDYEYKLYTHTVSSTNWGTLGTATEIRIGNHYDGSSENYQCSDVWNIKSAALWTGATLTAANIFAICNITSSPSADDNNIGMVHDVNQWNNALYTKGDIPAQPNHRWDLGRAVTDVGSTGGFNLTAVGTPDEGTAPW